MANAEVGSAYVSVIPSTKGFNEGVATAAFDGMKTAALGVQQQLRQSVPQ